MLTDTREFGLSRFQVDLDRVTAEQNKEGDTIFGNNPHPSQILRPMQSQGVPQLQRWPSRESYDDRFVTLGRIYLAAFLILTSWGFQKRRGICSKTPRTL